MKAERVSVSIVQDIRRVKNDNTIPLKLRLTFKGKRKYYATSFSLTNKDWLWLNSPLVKGKLRTIKNEFSKIELEAEKAITQIIPFSFKEFESVFFRKLIINCTIKELFEAKISKLYLNEQIGTALSYKDALTSLSNFKQNLFLNDVTVSFLQDYEKWMLQNNKAKATIGIYLRSLRSILNIAIEDKLMSKENYPFGNRKYIIPTGQNIKKALDLNSIKLIFEYPTPKNTNMRMAKDFWIFSYLCNGINTMDIANLQWKNLNKDTIIFERQKTKNTHKGNATKIVALRNNEINKIIDKWSNKNKDADNFIFNIIEKSDSAEFVQKKVHQFIKIINKWMKRIGKELGFEVTLTTYVARHSFATILVQNGAPLEFACQSLGHTNITTTQRYFAGFDLKAHKEFTKALTNF